MRWTSWKTAVVLLALSLAGLASAEDREAADLQLKRLGTISGRVVAEATGEPISDVRVSVYNLAGSLLRLVETDARGAFRFAGLLAGTYFVDARHGGEYLDEVYDGVACSGSGAVATARLHYEPLTPPCVPLAGSPVVVQDDTESVIEIDLLRGGTVSGRVTDKATGEPVSDVLLVAEEIESVHFSFYGTSDADGRYEIVGLPTATYSIGTYATEDYPGQVSEITVMADTDISPVDFALTLGGRITGRVVEAVSGNSVPGATVRFLDAVGPQAAVETDSSGRYSYAPLAPGSYEISVSSPFHLPATREDIQISSGETTGVDFVLTGDGVGRGSISGRVVAEGTGQPLAGVYLSVFPQLPENSLLGATTDDGGRYRLENLAAGTYHVKASAHSFYEDEIYDDVLCGTCYPGLGTAVEVEAGRRSSGVDFALARNGRLVGQVFDEESGEPIREGSVVVYHPRGYLLAEDDLADGTFSFDSIDSGLYYVLTRVLRSVDEIYPGLPCLNAVCDFTAADLVEMGSGAVTEIDFSLSRAARLTGRVTAAETGDRLPFVEVTVYDKFGVALLSARTNDSGAYEFNGLPGGRYYLATPGAHGYGGELFGGLPCPFAQCDVTSGQAVSVRPGTARRRLDLELDFGAGSLSGIVREETTGQRVPDLLIRLYDERGRRIASSRTDLAGFYFFSSIPAGTYYLRTPDTSTYQGELYDDVACPRGCRITRGTPVEIGAGAALTDLDFDLRRKP